jgi:hypothetical protein
MKILRPPIPKHPNNSPNFDREFWMKSSLLSLFLLLIFNSLKAQVYSLEHTYFLIDNLEVKQDSIVFVCTTDFSLTEYLVEGPLKRRGDTIVLNPGVTATPLGLLWLTRFK